LKELAKPDGLTLYYCVGSTAVTQQAFGAEGVKFNLRSWEMLGSVDRAASVGPYPARQTGKTDEQRKNLLWQSARGTVKTPWSTIFLWGGRVSQLECAVDFRLSGRRRAPHGF